MNDETLMMLRLDGAERLSQRFKALGHPVRLDILRRLARARACCGEIVAGSARAQSTVSQHLLVLKEAGLITGTIAGPRSCYCLDTAALQKLRAEVDALLAELTAVGSDSAATGCARADAPDEACRPECTP